ncbi:MAG: O-antigen ligase family protein [Bacteroidales bacterium]|jgi:O-antigen ligase|nr:O-antigen ligase family protein [Bacteroidales bacterium]
MNKKLIITLGIGAVFILVNCFAITKEFLYIPVLSVVVVLAYLFIYRLDIMMYVMAFVTPLSITFSDEKINIGLSIPAEIIMILLSLIFFARLFYDIRLERKIVLHPISVVIYLYLFWMLITSVSSEIPLVSFKYLASKIWFITSCYFCVTQFVKNDIKRMVVFINCYAFTLGVVIIYATAKLVLSGFAVRGMHWIMTPFYNDHTAYGAAIAFFIPLITALLMIDGKTVWRKLYYFLLLAVMFMGLYFSYCRAAWLSVIFAFCVWLVIRLRIKFSWLIVGFAILGTMLYYFSDDILYRMGRNSQDSSGEFFEHITSMSNISTDASNVERINRWVAAFGMIEERPVMGWGPGTYQFLYAGYQKGKYKTIISTNFGTGGNAHSEYIGPWAEMGLLGAIIVIILMFTVIFVGLRAAIRAKEKIPKMLVLFSVIALITYYVHGIMNNFLDTDKLSLPFWAAIAVIVVVDIGQRQREN